MAAAAEEKENRELKEQSWTSDVTWKEVSLVILDLNYVVYIELRNINFFQDVLFSLECLVKGILYWFLYPSALSLSLSTIVCAFSDFSALIFLVVQIASFMRNELKFSNHFC